MAGSTFAANAHLCQILRGRAIQEEKFLHINSFLKRLPEKQKQVDELMFTMVGKQIREKLPVPPGKPTNKLVKKENYQWGS